jgi:GntR family transcriptional repressor for pyruvate dehydrogenase complex
MGDGLSFELSEEFVARPFGLLLKLSGATIADVAVARTAMEPVAARHLAESGNHSAYNELERMVENDIRAAYESGNLAEVSARFHRRMVELSGNATLSMIAGMLHETAEKHYAAAIKRKRTVAADDYHKVIRSYRRLIEFLRAGDGDKAEAHWRSHMEKSRAVTLKGLESVKVRDIID